MTDAKIKAIAPWFGSKRNLACDIIAELGQHSSYWEPFCGSMAVLLNKAPCSHEHVNDLHGELINLARVIQHSVDGPRLYRKLRRFLFCEAFHAEAKERLQRGEYTSHVERAADYFIMSWMGRNGVSGTGAFNQTFARRWTPHGGQGGQRFASAVDSIPAWHRRLRRVTICQMDAFELLDKVEDCDGVAIYLDPPYLVKGAKYVHDFADNDHRRLADAVKRFKNARVVVSYYDHQSLHELYAGWTMRKIEVSKATALSGTRGAEDVRAIEVLLINGSSHVERRDTPLFDNGPSYAEGA